MEAAYVEYEVSGFEAQILRLAAQCADDQATARAEGDLKSARAAVRQILATLQRLGLPASDREL